MLRKELKEKFLRDFTPPERVYFLKKAREAIFMEHFPPSEDLFFYCYFLTIKERLRRTFTDLLDGYGRLIMVEALREVEDTIRDYRQRLVAMRLRNVDTEADRFIEWLGEV